MHRQSEEMHERLEAIFDAFPDIHMEDIPRIDLYMDQVTTFLQESLRGLSRDPAGDKFLTKTMINNYVKNKVLIPPVRKKYSREHMMLLIMIYYMKSFLSIGDIRSITGPVMERYASVPADRAEKHKDSADKKTGRNERAAGSRAEKGKNAQPEMGIGEIYEEIIRRMDDELPRIRADIDQQIDLAAEDFADVPPQERDLLQRFSLISRLSAEVYMRKLFIEKLLDEQAETDD